MCSDVFDDECYALGDEIYIVLSFALRTNDMEVRFNNSRMIWLFSSEQYFV